MLYNIVLFLINLLHKLKINHNFAIADRNADHASWERSVRTDLTVWG